MLPATASKTHRKPLALAIVLLVVGLAPAAAIIGFCTRMPCCNHAAAAAPEAALSTGANDCCTTITCYESPSAKLTNGVAARAAAFAAPAVVPAVAVARQVMLAPGHVDTSPPPLTRHRLAILSTLLI